MDDLLTPAPLTNAAEYSVSEISGALKRVVEDRFGHVRVRGEISGYRGPHSSGHAYFSLKDDRSRLESVIWKTTMARLKFRPEEGMEVIATGKLTTYPGKSNYQIVIDQLEPAGAGALMALLEERKRRLAQEGLFEAGRKRALPFMPKVIGVVTSPTGAVIRDILHRIADRFPLHVIVWPVRVQGETSGTEVCAAIQGFNALAADGAIPRPDVLIVARGGGSLEDLWGFNDEACARAVFASHIPLIAAIGHETDWTLIDLVADRRAPTPTGAAEMAVPVKADLQARLASLGARLQGAARRHLDRRNQAVRGLARALPSADAILAMPRRRLDENTTRLQRSLQESTHRKRVRLDGLRLAPGMLARRTSQLRRDVSRCSDRLPDAMRRGLEKRRTGLPSNERMHRSVARLLAHQRALLARLQGRIRSDGLAAKSSACRARLSQIDARRIRGLQLIIDRKRAVLTSQDRVLTSLSYRSVLQRGFVVVHGTNELPLTLASHVNDGEALSLEFSDGRVAVTAGLEAKTAPEPFAKVKPKAKPTAALQTNLFDF